MTGENRVLCDTDKQQIQSNVTSNVNKIENPSLHNLDTKTAKLLTLSGTNKLTLNQE